MRRTIGAILMLTRPDRMIRSAWRGDARVDVLLELLAVEVAAQEVPRAALLDLELLGAARRLAGDGRGVADYFHSSAPRRQTYTKAMVRSAMNTIVSTI